MSTFRVHSEEFMRLIGEMDALLATHRDFRLDTWTQSARNLIPAHADWLEWNALTLITVWGPRGAANQGGLHDYSHRQWHGLLDLYALRWHTFFDAELSSRGSGTKIDWFEIEKKWVEDSLRKHL
jgi:alpha-N-acetylglucosaminidase